VESSLTSECLETDQAQLLMRNAQQILDIITATFGPQILELETAEDGCSTPDGDYEELVCQWKQVSASAGSVDELDAEWVSSTIKVIFHHPTSESMCSRAI